MFTVAGVTRVAMLCRLQAPAESGRGTMKALELTRALSLGREEDWAQSGRAGATSAGWW